MNIPTIDRLKLMHEVWERKLSDDMVETIVQIIESTRINQGHLAAEEKAKEIRELIEQEPSEAVLLQKLDQIKYGNT